MSEEKLLRKLASGEITKEEKKELKQIIDEIIDRTQPSESRNTLVVLSAALGVIDCD